VQKFVPQMTTKVDAVRHINYTCSPEQYEELETIAHDAGVSLKELIRQMVQFALKNRD